MPRRKSGEFPDYLIPVGRTLGVDANGSVSNIPVFPSGVIGTRRAIEEGDFDVVHLHEPMTPVNGWDTCLSSDVPVVGTFHAYSTKPVPNLLGKAAGARRASTSFPAGSRSPRPRPGPGGAVTAATTRSSPTGWT